MEVQLQTAISGRGSDSRGDVMRVGGAWRSGYNYPPGEWRESDPNLARPLVPSDAHGRMSDLNICIQTRRHQ